MIHFQLRCEPAGHGFDGWFRSGEDFDAQCARGLVQCPACGSQSVAKALMAPALATGKEAPAASGPQAVTGAPAELARAYAKLQEMAREVRANSEYVGRDFAQEARRIHFGEAQERRIYGEASGAEVKALAEDGIPALPLPALPEDGH
ncbi:DUF1178 family protein [Aureimonas populi]|uniref:DUF1178 family protein n=1 Tax=Aureimonas populi TaxID=1701758 RepID=A0ABW5CH84_9HYPH|nr:DUF1178 family protein [Aureimonas populi]